MTDARRADAADLPDRAGDLPDRASDLLARASDPRDAGVTVLAYPGRRLTAPLRRGDVLLDGARAAFVDEPALLDRGGARRLGADTRAPGRYVAVAGDRRALRIAGPDGLLLPETIVLRLDGDADQALAFGAANPPVLQIGSHGPAVRDAQARLNALDDEAAGRDGTGRNGAALKTDGRYGPRTRDAVGRFQRRALPRRIGRRDGVLDALTWSALLSHNAAPTVQQIAVNQTANAAPPAPVPPVTEPPLDPADPFTAGEQAPDITAADIAANLAAVTVTTTTQALGLQPDVIAFNAIAYANTPSKRTVFNDLAGARRREVEAEQRVATARAAVPAGATPTATQARGIAAAERTLASAHRTVETASAAIQRWLRAHGRQHNRALRALAPRRRNAEQALAAARRRGVAAEVAAAQTTLGAIVAETATATAEVDRLIAAFVPLVATTRNIHAVAVDGHTVRLHDHVIAYATVDARGMEGKADGDTRAVVNARLGQVATNDPLRILSIISQHEGTFSNVNTWDRAVVTWGFIQWTFGEDGDGSLVPLLAEVKRSAPQVYHNRLQRYGIDIDARAVELARADGTIVRGADAASAIRIDPRLTAILSRLGVEQAVQDIQIRHAVATRITAVRARRVPGHPVTIGDVVSSSHGVGVMTDRCVARGTGAVLDSVGATLTAFVRQHPGVDLGQPAGAAQAEPAVVAALVAMDTQRAAAFAGLSQLRGSFTP